MTAFSGFYESHEPLPSGDAHGIVPKHRHGQRNGQQSGHILHLCFVCCRPSGRCGNTEQVVAKWQCPVASGEALVMLHWEMYAVLHRRTVMAMETACNGGAFVCCCHLIHLT
jgi:hypothetical protein